MAQYQIFVQYQYQYFQEFCFQNQYQYQNSSNNFFNIKININIKIFPPSISKSISKFFKTQDEYQNQYQYRQNIDIDIENQNFSWLKNLFFHILWLMPLGTYGIPSNTHSPQTWNLGTLLGPKCPIQRPMVSHLWTPLAKNGYWAKSMKTWDPTRNLLHLNYNLRDPK